MLSTTHHAYTQTFRAAFSGLGVEDYLISPPYTKEGRPLVRRLGGKAVTRNINKISFNYAQHPVGLIYFFHNMFVKY